MRTSLLLAVSLVFAVTASAQAPPLAVVSGRVTGDGGAPIANARMVYRGGPYDSRLESFTNASGRYTMSLPTGTWEVVASAAGYISQLNGGDDCTSDVCPVYAETLYVERGMQRTVDFALRRTALPSGTIAGSVLDEATGRPILLSGVQAFREHRGGAMYQTTADAQGRYSLRVPPGRYVMFGVYGGFNQPPYIPRSGRLTCATSCVAGHEGSMTTVGADETATVDHRLSTLYVRDVTPRGGTAGTTVTITGSPFNGSERVRIGTTEVRPTLVSPTELRFVAPSGSGSADIVVVRGGYTAGFPFPWTWHDTARTYVTLTPPAAYPRSGETATATLTLSRAQAEQTAVAITAPGYIRPMTVKVPAGETSVPVPLRAQRGSFEVTATLPEALGGFSTGFAHGVTSTSLSLDPAQSLVARGSTVTLTAILATPQPVDTVLELIRRGIGLPDAIVIPADQTRVTFSGTMEEVFGRVEATPPAYVAPRAVADIETFVPLSVSAIFDRQAARYGATLPITLRLSERLQRDATITFRDLSGGAFRLPASVPVPAGVTEVRAEFTMLRPGSGLAFAIDVDGEQRGSIALDVRAPHVWLTPQGATLDAATAQTATVTVEMDGPLPFDLPFSIDSDRTRLDAPLSGMIAAGSTNATFVVTARASGRVRLTVQPDPRSGAFANWTMFDITGPPVQVPARLTITTNPNRRQFAVGEQFTLAIAITPASAANFTVTVTTTDPGMLTNLPETFTYAAGDTMAWIAPRVVRAGRTRITVSARGQFASIDLVGGNPPPQVRRRSSR